MLKMWENIGGDEVIAQLVERDQIPNFIKEAVVGPNEAMIYIRNGKIEDILTQDKVKAEPQGIIGWFKSKMGGGDLVQILFVSTGVIDLNISLGKSTWKMDPAGKVLKDERGGPQWEVQGILSKDHEEIKGTCTIRIQINQNNAKQIFNLMRSAEGMVGGKVEAKSSWWGRNVMGRAFNAKPAMVAGKFLLKSDLEEKVNNELVAKVLYPQLSSLDISQLKGNLDLIKQIETATEVELRKSFELWGMNLVQFFTVFDRSASDALAAHKKKKMLIFEQAESDKYIDVKGAINDRNRQYEIDRNELEKHWAMQFGDQAGRDRLDSMELEAALARDAMARSQEVKMRGVEFDEDNRQKKTDGMTYVELKKAHDDAEIAREKAEIGMAMSSFAQVQEAKRQRVAMEQKHTEDIKRMDVDTQQMGVTTANQQIITLQQQIADLEIKIVDAPVEKQGFLQNMINQKTIQMQSLQQEATKRQLGTVGGDASDAFMQSEGLKHNLETYKSAEDREREHDIDRRRSDAELMEASKQNVSQYVGGGQVPHQQPSVNVVTVQGNPTQQSGDTCPECGTPIKPKCKVCPECDYRLVLKSDQCAKCGEDMEPKWKLCPNCGEKR